jgi:SAM-dependent methyltransferase
MALSSFNDVSDEYYNTSRHPTCNNFRFGSSLIIADWLARVPQGKTICEIGAGKSIVAEQLEANGQSLDRLLITDQSASMLEYSQRFRMAGATLLLADAENLPIQDHAFDLLVASLGDPYNKLAFWFEAARVIKPGGSILFSVPSYDWAMCFRGRTFLEFGFASAEFELKDGRHVLLPSYIYPEGDQRIIIEKAGLKVVEVRHILIKDLQGQKLSTRLCAERGPEGRVVTGYSVKTT